jgi:hypothetical protein
METLVVEEEVLVGFSKIWVRETTRPVTRAKYIWLQEVVQEREDRI